MKVRDLTAETWSALTANKARSALTMLGVIIGIGAVITMNALIGGLNKAESELFGADSARLIEISFNNITGVTDQDAKEIGESLPSYETVIPSLRATASVTNGTKKADGTVNGVKPIYFKAHAFKFVQGSAFTEEEEAKGEQLIVLDTLGVKKFFGSEKSLAVGESIRIGNDEYSIVGVIEPTSDARLSAVYSPNSITVYAPFSTVATRIVGNREVQRMEGFAREGEDIDALVVSTKQFLTKRYRLPEQTSTAGETDLAGLMMETENTGAPNVNVTANKTFLEQLEQQQASFSMIMSSVSAISLLVGGIGIMNMMLTNVTERIREIGLRKALGARRIDITSQFMLESVLLCMTGGFIGIVLGLAGAFGLAGIAQDMLGSSYMKLTPVIDINTVLNATFTCIVVGVVFGWYPARRAARLDPVESLNHQ